MDARRLSSSVWLALPLVLSCGAALAQQNSDHAQLPSRTIATPDGGLGGTEAALLTVDQDLLFVRSAWGLRAQSVTDTELQKIATENDRLATQLSEEEAQLTEQRATLDPAEFRRLAEAFDLRATQVRRERAQLLKDLDVWAEADRAAFYRAALPIMGDMMQERGAVAVLDRRTVFVALDTIDMTDDLVRKLDQELGDGKDVVPFNQTPSADAPE